MTAYSVVVWLLRVRTYWKIFSVLGRSTRDTVRTVLNVWEGVRVSIVEVERKSGSYGMRLSEAPRVSSTSLTTLVVQGRNGVESSVPAVYLRVIDHSWARYADMNIVQERCVSDSHVAYVVS